jgi:four helix bundle protein
LGDFWGLDPADRRRWMALRVLLPVCMSEESERLKKRTMRFALDVCGLLKQLPIDEPGPTVRHQLVRAATGVAFNYRSTCRARSHTEFTSRIGIVAEEADESQGWLEFIDDAQLIAGEHLKRLRSESDELVAIFSASVGTAREKERQRKTKPRRSR